MKILISISLDILCRWLFPSFVSTAKLIVNKKNALEKNFTELSLVEYFHAPDDKLT